MKTFVRKKIEVTLVLDEEEATYLGALTQNFLGGDLRDEAVQEQQIRISIFNAIKKSFE